eukprot:scaffold16995_cov127-Skeletonema_marinoi.AAC.1
MANTHVKSLSSGIYPSTLSWPTIMGNKKMFTTPITTSDTIYIWYFSVAWCWRVELAAISDASSGHLRRCSDADTTNQCLSRAKDASILSWPTIMGH